MKFLQMKEIQWDYCLKSKKGIKRDVTRETPFKVVWIIFNKLLSHLIMFNWHFQTQYYTVNLGYDTFVWYHHI